MEPFTKQLNNKSHSNIDLSAPQKAANGSVLIIILIFLALITVVILAFVNNVSQEKTSAKTYANGITVKQLSDFPVQLVMAQIKNATSQSNVAWTSQPGAIRTFGNISGSITTASSAPLGFFKLYSSNSMQVSPSLISSFDFSNDVSTTWDQNTALYTDLNSPTLRPDLTASGNPPSLEFPIIDPRAQNVVLGFSYSATNSNGNVVDKVITSGSDDDRRLPMPVMWLYVLKDGSIIAPDVTSTSIATFQSSPSYMQPSADNPIVGRVAFWTDDETSKVNINTAAGDAWNTTPSASTSPSVSGAPGSYWSKPFTFSTFDYNCLAFNQPINHEYQRYPGHPATTYLSGVFTNLPPAQIASIVPRIVSGGSQGGIIDTTSTVPPAITPDSDRIYSSVDELLFDPSRSINNLSPSNPITPSILAKAKFFLTASSRAPELNLFHQPRISMWPITDTSAPASSQDTSVQATTPLDKLFVFCSTINGNKYYLERYDSTSQTNDYLNVPRNRDLYSYLKSLMSTSIPGVGGSYNTKYPDEYQQILTEMMDYIRCTNISDHSTSATPYANATINGVTAAGQILPLRVNSTQGFGRMSTIPQVGLQFYTVDYPTGGIVNIQAVFVFNLFSPALGFPAINNNFDVEITGLDSFHAIVNTTVPNTSSAGVGKNVALNFPADARITIRPDLSIWHERPYGGSSGVGPIFMDRRTPRLLSPGSYPFYSGIFTTLANDDLKTCGPVFQFLGGKITLKIFPVGDTDPSHAIQTMTLQFPDAPLVTEFGGTVHNVGYGVGGWPVPGYDGNSYNYRLSVINSDTGAGYLISGGDTVKTLQVAGNSDGDPRMIAGVMNSSTDSSVPANYRWQPHILYNQTGFNKWGKQDYYFRQGDGVPYYVNSANGIFGLVTSGITSTSDIPNRNLTLSGPQNLPPSTAQRSDGKPGDFDTGLSNYPDNGYINKPDEGDVLAAGGHHPYYFDSGYAPGLPVTQTLFSPNRMIPSPVVFGSLPTGMIDNKPWQTLLFNPYPASATVLNSTISPNHPGAVTPADEYLLDLFWMPVVEPYAISEPFSTAGKINLNCAIAPFSYITRTTGLQAALKPLMIGSLTPSDSSWHKTPPASDHSWLNPVDVDKAISFINSRNSSTTSGHFVSATQICEVPLVPLGQANSWIPGSLTGDNVRETPYADIYPRITTQSNTFTVHMRVQSLQKIVSTPVGIWDDNNDHVVSEYRGSSLIERYIDPDDNTIPDCATATASNLDNYYHFRVISTKQFAP